VPQLLLQLQLQYYIQTALFCTLGILLIVDNDSVTDTQHHVSVMEPTVGHANITATHSTNIPDSSSVAVA